MRNLQDVQNVDLQNSVSPAPRGEIDFIKLNKERTSIATKLAIQLNNGVPPPNYRKGVIPKYDVANNFSPLHLSVILKEFFLFSFVFLNQYNNNQYNVNINIR